ncbi:MAG: UDP-N-acetylmuramoyl-tripeptide--D-alanyl-D-alanine ligase [Myxococcota bacterium]|nr:UDP-N-acetylmuramoyl-tripeptide--D-alanyl-D-alanine ligase [Myxococcota bacterium]
MSVPFSAEEARAWTSSALVQGAGDTRFDGVSIDTRTVSEGDLFVAIVGPNHDAHHFLADAVERGARGLLVQADRKIPHVPAKPAVLAAPDTTLALGALAHGHRTGFEGPVVGITGSNGKTTTKEMCASILEVGAPTLRTRGNLNNNFGLPLTLLCREPEHRRAVVELGMNHPGEIAPLAAIAQPTVGVVTNIGTAHIEFLGSREGIAQEKGALLEALAPEGVAVVNAEDDFADALAARTRARVVRFGGSGDVRAEGAQARDDGTWSFRLSAPEGDVDVRVAGLGGTTVINALAAAAAALAAGAGLDEVAEGLAGYGGVGGRLERKELPGRIVVIDDSYNANPQSMAEALQTLAGCGGRRIAVLGDMGELGETTDRAHDDAGRLAARLGIDFLVAVGERADRVAAGARDGGLADSRIRTAADSDEGAAAVREILEPGTTVLLKGSRAMKMERVARHLEAEARP